jgi:O-6-methylguanine DNA methyltransferase
MKLIKYLLEKLNHIKILPINIGKPNASRAVANACGQNPLPVIRPCHRVICSNGNIGGYSAPGGAQEKIRLLKVETKSNF